MFESAEIGHKVSRKDYKAREPALRSALLQAQYQLLAQARSPVIILVNGVDGAGKGETVNLLNEWMDPRHIRTEAFGAVGGVEAQRPEMHRFWHVMPAKGRIGILFGSWYTDPILAHVMGHERKARFAQRLERIRQFERMLAAEGTVLVKLWFHLSKKAVRQRFRALEKDPRNAWRVTADDWERHKHYDEFVAVAEKALRKTSTGEAPWQVIEGADPAYRALTAGGILLDALQGVVKPVRPAAPPAAVPPPRPPIDGRTLLASFDYTRRLERRTYERKLEDLQFRLATLSRDPRFHQRSLVLVFEGMDAGGKGSTIRRLTGALDARHYRVIPVAAPSDEERAQPYLWRFWRHVPHRGHTALFDRSWYGRVLVERVEGLCTEADWMRAYDEINAFEEQLAEAGAMVLKFWLAITPDEQLRRFEARKETPFKQFKITEDDWRNRKKWPLYEVAAGDMLERTSTDVAPWHVVATDDKLLARIEVLTRVCERIEKALAG
ncbi:MULTISPECIES: polyphosphate:AMP phosphotransferase [Ramlibacter]|uniref:Polyphosphate:AMP phosphotransferase n=1 Tax=Ramlibacter aquaticus TaxID=2780094 RepID=A0ABR9SFL5_9BURK|nr:MULTISPECIES: polyphosphate:AMP phosphotransferase [Ramlibacter]MBE7941141.1 polyphosphate:AMP phosphotransferase [Ramlibacter aquaticus]